MPGSRDQKALQTARAREFRQWNGLADTAIVPDEMITASASGLDPHIGREAALLQVARIAKARGIAPALVTALVVARTEPPQFGFLGQERVNVVLLNVELDRMAGP
jgi:K+-transporting ATPase ATPase C chain